MNAQLAALRCLPRNEILRTVREVTGDGNLVFWEQIGYGWMYREVPADQLASVRLGVEPGTIIGYRVLSGHVMGGALADLMNAEPQNDPPFPDPFR
jgi:hypothetical protein